MAGVDATERSGFTFIWKIENFSYCLQNQLTSPSFFVKAFSDSQWNILLFPRGNGDRNHIAVYIQRLDKKAGMLIDCELSFLADDGTVLRKWDGKTLNFASTHANYAQHGEGNFVTRDEILRSKRDAYLPKDTLMVCCRMWKNDPEQHEAGQCCVRTRIAIERRSFTWSIEEFSTNRDAKETVYLPSVELTVKFFLSDGTTCENKVQLEICHSNGASPCFSTFRISLLDVQGEACLSSRDEHLFDTDANTQPWQFPSHMTESWLMAKKDLCFPNDVLSFRCEFVVSIGQVSSEIDEFRPLSYPNAPVNGLKYLRCFVTGRNPSDSRSTLKDDLHCLYKDQKFCDAKLQVGNKTFSVHKNVICARSPMFRAMFESDMKEGRTGIAEIPDVDEDTVDRMLSFLYIDDLGDDVQWDSLSKLYFSADKYGIQTLKRKCLSILPSKLCPITACEALVLADMHHDEDMKMVVRDFILSHDDEILRSEEWGDLEQNNPQLTTKILRQICLKKIPT